MNILIIESSKVCRRQLEIIFTPHATNLYISESGAKGIRIYETSSIDLVCISFYLSDMEGVEFVKQVRELKWGRTLPILMITSDQSQDETAKSLQYGATEVFRQNDLPSLERYLSTSAEFARQQANLSGIILLIDSDKEQAEKICDFFKGTRLQFVCFTNAEQAADMARAAEFDLVITNVVLGGPMSGMALIREIRKINDMMYRVPILAITASQNVSQKIELLRAGASDSIEKPILLEEMSVRVKNLLQTKKLFDTVELQKIQLEEMAFHDPLTTLFNRHHLIDVADRILEDSQRHQYPVSLLVIDLDHFKKINDAHGHGVGDAVLQGVAKLLKCTFRENDIPVRFGGEEFIILLPHCGKEDALTRAETLRVQIEKLLPISIPVTASIGVSLFHPNQKVGYEEVFAAADKAVYDAKNEGRNCVIFREPVSSSQPTTRSLKQ